MGHWVGWALLGIVTFGFYFIFAGLHLEKWLTKHTHFEEGYSPVI